MILPEGLARVVVRGRLGGEAGTGSALIPHMPAIRDTPAAWLGVLACVESSDTISEAADGWLFVIAAKARQ
jgi:hypothetical protein